jgi:hypothetical protein
MADTETVCWTYPCYMITTFQDAGEWWAITRGMKKDAGGGRRVLGCPWKSKPEARTVAEAFCGSGRAG